MAVKKIILTNTLYQLLGKFVSTASTVIVSVIITRMLGAQTWGEYSIVISYITLFYVFTELGINSIAAREFTALKNVPKKHFYSVVWARFVLTLIISVISVVCLYFLNYPPHIKIAILFGQFGLILYSVSSSFNSIFQAKLCYKYLFYATIAFSVINLGLFLLLVPLYRGNLILLLIPIAVGEVFRFCVSLYFANKLLSKQISKGNPNTFAKNVLLMAAPLAMVLILNTLMVQIDRIMLSVMVAPVFLGFYSLSYRLFDVLLVFPTFFMNSAFPIFSEKYKTEKNYNDVFTQSLIFLLAVAFISTVLSIIIVPVLLPLIWGIEMTPAVLSFNTLIVGSVFFYLSSILSWNFVVENKQHILIFVYGFGLITNFILNLYYIPKLSFEGAALTTIFTEALVVLLLVLLTYKHLTVRITRVNNLLPWKLYK